MSAETEDQCASNSCFLIPTQWCLKHCWIWHSPHRHISVWGVGRSMTFLSYFPRWMFHSEWITPPLSCPHQCWMNKSSLRNTTNDLLLYIIFPIPAKEQPILKPRSSHTTEPSHVKMWNFQTFFWPSPVNAIPKRTYLSKGQWFCPP